MNVALIGSVSSSLACLEALVESGVEVVGVLGVDESRADGISDYRSLRQAARQAGLPFQAFEKVTEPGVATFLGQRPHDLLWVIGLSQMMPAPLVDIARVGGVGFHPTMLPEGRGRAPVAWTILRGARAAASLFFLTDEPDAGDIIAQEEVAVRPDDYSEDLIARTNVTLKSLVRGLAPAIQTGQIPRRPQDHAAATYYEKRTPSDGLIDWSQSTDQVYRLIRAAGRPYPGAFSWLGGDKLTVWRAEPADRDVAGQGDALPGTVLDVVPTRGLLVRTGDGSIWVTEPTIAAESLDVAGVRCGCVLRSCVQEGSKHE